jgi:branched-chain amino acid transport system ATP-binding protein
VLLLDEPAAGIAQREVEGLQQVLLRVRDESAASLAVIEHDVPLLSAISDSLVCMHLGQVIAEGAPAVVLADPLVVASYLGTDEAAIARSRGPMARVS